MVLRGIAPVGAAVVSLAILVLANTVVAEAGPFPVGAGFVASIPRPAGNATGFVTTEGSMAGNWRARTEAKVTLLVVLTTTGLGSSRCWRKEVHMSEAGRLFASTVVTGRNSSVLKVSLAARQCQRLRSTSRSSACSRLVSTERPHRNLTVRRMAADEVIE
jgi:hypothetical protein